MRTVGIDLSADPSKTAMSLEWMDGMTAVGPPTLKGTNDVLIDEL